MRVCMLLHKSVVHDARVRREARALAGAGHELTVLELAPVAAGDELLDGFARRSASPPGWMRRWLPFTSYRAAFLVSFVARGVRLRPEVVHAHDAAMLAPGALIARLTGARLIYDSHELATGVAYRSGAWERFVGALEALLVPRCAAVITVSDAIAARLRERYGLRVVPVVLRNVCDLPLGPRRDGKPGLRERLGLATEPLVLHHGSVAEGRGADVLVRAVAGLPGVHAAFLGGGDEPGGGALPALAERVGAAGRVHVLPSAPLQSLLADAAEADVGVSLLQDSCENHRLALPNKLFEYLRAGLPVVVSDLPELRRLVLERQVGWTVAPADPRSVGDGLRAALAAAGDAGLAARVAAAADELSWERERARLLDLYAALVVDGTERVCADYRGYARSPRHARRWAAGNAGNVRMRAELLERLLAVTERQRGAGAEVLDIGCGAGYWLAELGAHGVAPARLHGADLIEHRAAAAGRRVPGATVHHADGERLPYADGRFGIVLLFTTLSSAGEPARRGRILAEARRLLAPGGVLLVYEPRVPNPLNRNTARVARGELDALGLPARHESLTVLPALARRMGGYNVLRRVPALRTHRLSALTR